MIFAVKHDGNLSLVDILTQPAIEIVYSGVVSIHSICLILLIAKLNDLTIYQADVRNAYLEAYTKRNYLFHCWKRIPYIQD